MVANLFISVMKVGAVTGRQMYISIEGLVTRGQKEEEELNW